MGRIVAFANQKGGVGKTTACINLAAGLALLGKKCLIVDANPQGNATTGLGIKKSGNALYDVLVCSVPARDAVRRTATERLFAIPSCIELAGGEIELVPLKNRERRLKDALFDVSCDYDFIAIDCPPSLGLLTVNALVAADSIIIPVVPEYYALEGLVQLLNTVKSINGMRERALEIDGVLITQTGRSLLARQITGQIKEHFKDKVFAAAIPPSARIAEAPSFGLPVFMHSGESMGARAYADLAKEYLERVDM